MPVKDTQKTSNMPTVQHSLDRQLNQDSSTIFIQNQKTNPYKDQTEDIPESLHGSAQSKKVVDQIEIKKRIERLNVDSDEEQKFELPVQIPRQEEEEKEVQISSERDDRVQLGPEESSSSTSEEEEEEGTSQIEGNSSQTSNFSSSVASQNI